MRRQSSPDLKTSRTEDIWVEQAKTYQRMLNASFSQKVAMIDRLLNERRFMVDLGNRLQRRYLKDLDAAFGAVKPHHRPEDWSRVRDEMETAMARDIVAEDQEIED